MIQARGLVKSFGDVEAVRGLDLRVERGEIHGLLGPNGAGKSTTIHMLVGLLAPDDGTIAIGEGGDPRDRATRRLIGVAPQSLSLYEEFNALENLRFFAKLHGLRGDHLEKRVRSAIADAGLEQKAQMKVRGYSGGMKRRLNLACALVHEPELVFLDEPTAGVDPQSRARLFENIEALKALGKTVVYTTHQMEEAERLCDRISIIDAGRILELGTVDELIARHGGKSRVAARLTGPAPAGAVSPGVLDGDNLEFTSAEPLESLVRLRESGWPLADFRVDSPNLEAVFLELTGKRIRD